MAKLVDTTEWREFRVGDLFDVRPTKNYGLKNSELFSSDGNIRVVVNSAQNNGVGGYVGLEPTEPGNIVTFSDTTDANGIFVQDDSFVGYSHVQGMHCKDDGVSFRALQFFATVFKAKAMAMGFDYQNKFRRDVASEIVIKLPVTADGKPDWDYMERYMARVMDEMRPVAEELHQLESTLSLHAVDVSEWKEFRVGELFETISVSNKLTRHDIEDGGSIPFYSSTVENGGIEGYTNSDAEFCVGDGFFIVFGDHTRHFAVAETDFSVMDNVKVLRPLCGDATAWRFLCEVWRCAIPNLGYARHWSVAKGLKISLPVDLTGKPDWDAMAEMMRGYTDSVREVAEVLYSLTNK